MIFTRLLYCYDEVKINLLISIIKKDFKQSIFWASEIYESGFKDELIELLWKIYYDFFALKTFFNTSKYKSDIRKYLNTKNNIFLFEFINKLCQSPYSFDIFIIRMFFKDKADDSDKIKKNYTTLMKLLFKANKTERFYKYLSFGSLLMEKSKLVCLIEEINSGKFKENNYYQNLSHQLLVFMFDTKVKIRKPPKKIRKQMVDYINHCKLFNCQTFKTLQSYRDYEISDLTSCFNLEREKLSKPLTEYFWYHWLYYASKTPYWEKKLDNYEYIINNETKEIIFKTDDDLEDFYQKNSYELDDLDFTTRNKSTKKLNNEYKLKDLLLSLDENLKLILNISRKIETIKNKY